MSSAAAAVTASQAVRPECRVCLCHHYPILESRGPPANAIYIQQVNQLVRPCRCSGSIAYVHQGCLMNMMYYHGTTHCAVCLTTFRPMRITLFAYRRNHNTRRNSV